MIDFDLKVHYNNGNRSHRASDSSVPWWAIFLKLLENIFEKDNKH